MAHEKWVRSVKPTSHFVTSYGVEWGIFSDRLSPWHDILICKPCSPVLRTFNLAQDLLIQFYCHCWIRPLHVNNCLVQLSYQIWPQKTTEGSPDCWANHWYNPPHSQRTVLIQDEQKGWQNPSGPLTSNTLPLWTVAVWSTIQSSEHQNDQKQILILFAHFIPVHT